MVAILNVEKSPTVTRDSYSVVVCIYKWPIYTSIFLRCDIPTCKRSTACDGFATSQMRHKTLQTFAKPISQCVFVGLRTPLNIVVSIGSARVDLPGDAYVHNALTIVRAALDWAALDWAALDWAALDWAALDRAALVVVQS